MVAIPAVRTYGNPADNPGQSRFSDQLPQGPQVEQPGHGDKDWDFVGFEPSASTIVRDRHGILNRGTEKTGRPTNQGDPSKDGPARPSLRLINRSFNPQQGTDSTRNRDDLTRGYRTNTTGQWTGSQDGSTSMIWGGTPGLYTPYGSYAGYTRGPVQGIQGAEVGQPGDGPQLIPNSPPHGLHSETTQNGITGLSRFSVTTQQKAGRVDRPSNSPIAGQSFSQTVLTQAQSRAVSAFAVEGAKMTIPVLGGGQWRGN